MTYEDFEEVFKMLVEERDKRDEFLNKLPMSINSAFFDNEMVDSLYKTINKLLEKLFTPNLLKDVEYFLYDYEFGWHFSVNYKEYKFETTDDILAYFKEQYFTDVSNDMPQDDTGC
jgi:hypothetical protein